MVKAFTCRALKGYIHTCIDLHSAMQSDRDAMKLDLCVELYRAMQIHTQTHRQSCIELPLYMDMVRATHRLYLDLCQALYRYRSGAVQGSLDIELYTELSIERELSRATQSYTYRARQLQIQSYVYLQRYMYIE